MKYYLLFLWGNYEAQGGMNDLHCGFAADSDQAAIDRAFAECQKEYGHWDDPNEKNTELFCIEAQSYRPVPFDYPKMKASFVAIGEGI